VPSLPNNSDTHCQRYPLTVSDIHLLEIEASNTLPGNLSFELSRGKTLSKLSENSLGFGMEAEEARLLVSGKQAV